MSTISQAERMAFNELPVYSHPWLPRIGTIQGEILVMESSIDRDIVSYPELPFKIWLQQPAYTGLIEKNPKSVQL